MSSWRYQISDIIWPEGANDNLPEEATVFLPGWLVLCDENVPEAEWEEVICDELAHQFGVRPDDVGGYEPDED